VRGSSHALDVFAGCSKKKPATQWLHRHSRMRLCSGAFANLSGEADREYFADGIVEDITTALSRMRWLVVIARNSSFTFKGRAVDAKQVGREWGYAISCRAASAGAESRFGPADN
jgi:TolB-like protein